MQITGPVADDEAIARAQRLTNGSTGCNAACSGIPKNSGAADKVPMAFALVVGRANAHQQLLRLLQDKVVGPLAERHLISGFRIISATPPTFVADASTLLVFEITLLSTAPPITERDVRQWQRRLDPDVHLAAAPTLQPRPLPWGLSGARAALVRAMSMGTAAQEDCPCGAARKKEPQREDSGWLRVCMERDKDSSGASKGPTPSSAVPFFCVESDDDGGLRRPRPGEALMSTAMAEALCLHLPATLRWRTAWRLAYSPRVHGVSIHTLHRRMAEEGPSLLIVQDHDGQVFGGFASAPWKVSDGYFGTGETFVFKFKKRQPGPGVAQWAGESDEVDEAAQLALDEAVKVLSDWSEHVRLEAARSERTVARALAEGANDSATEALDAVLGAPLVQTPRRPSVEEVPGSKSPSTSPTASSARGNSDESVANSLEVYCWSTRDPFFQYTDLECLAMGGGSAFALYIQEDLLHGVSEPSSTFDSAMLSSTQNFVISSLECWVFDDPSEAWNRCIFNRAGGPVPRHSGPLTRGA